MSTQKRALNLAETIKSSIDAMGKDPRLAATVGGATIGAVGGALTGDGFTNSVGRAVVGGLGGAAVGHSDAGKDAVEYMKGAAAHEERWLMGFAQGMKKAAGILNWKGITDPAAGPSKWIQPETPTTFPSLNAIRSAQMPGMKPSPGGGGFPGVKSTQMPGAHGGSHAVPGVPSHLLPAKLPGSPGVDAFLRPGQGTGKVDDLVYRYSPDQQAVMSQGLGKWLNPGSESKYTPEQVAAAQGRLDAEGQASKQKWIDGEKLTADQQILASQGIGEFMSPGSKNQYTPDQVAAARQREDARIKGSIQLLGTDQGSPQSPLQSGGASSGPFQQPGHQEELGGRWRGPGDQAQPYQQAGLQDQLGGRWRIPGDEAGPYQQAGRQEELGGPWVEQPQIAAAAAQAQGREDTTAQVAHTRGVGEAQARGRERSTAQVAGRNTAIANAADQAAGRDQTTSQVAQLKAQADSQAQGRAASTNPAAPPAPAAAPTIDGNNLALTGKPPALASRPISDIQLPTSGGNLSAASGGSAIAPATTSENVALSKKPLSGSVPPSVDSVLRTKFKTQTGTHYQDDSAMDKANMERIRGGQPTMNRKEYGQTQPPSVLNTPPAKASPMKPVSGPSVARMKMPEATPAPTKPAPAPAAAPKAPMKKSLTVPHRR